MLKIKDNVDLKELEKFGFKQDKDEWYSKDITGTNIFIKPLSRKMIIKAYNTCQYSDLDTVYGLIKADLVEKVEEK